jgi:hypothetical protein
MTGFSAAGEIVSSASSIKSTGTAGRAISGALTLYRRKSSANACSSSEPMQAEPRESGVLASLGASTAVIPP